jgi:hydroxymethylglutaryl-CoA synthase
MMKYKKLSGVGIVGYGMYIPRLRIKVDEIASSHGVDAEQIKSSLLVKQKSVADWDEDSCTMAYMAAIKALRSSGIPAEKIGAVYMGSESHPYAVKPSSTIIGEALRIGNDYMASDLEFACKSGTAGMQMIASHLISGMVSYGLVIGADKAQARPGDALEYTAAAGAAAFVLGKRRILAKLEGFMSYSSDTSDFWRRSEQRYPRHAGRFTGEPAYFRHVEESTKRFLQDSSTTAEDYDYVVFHMPNGKFPKRAAKRLGFSQKQLDPGLVVAEVGNTYSASSLIGLCRVLDKVGSGKRILLTSYGSGAGSDTLAFKTTDLLSKRRKDSSLRRRTESNEKNLSYGEYRILMD